MTLSREEIAVRLACADVQGSSLPPDKDRAVWAAQVVATTDAIGAALTPTPAPVAPPAYVPKVGDVVRFKESGLLWVVNGRMPSNPHFTVGITDTVNWSRGCCNPEELTFVRDSTDAEKRAAGLAVPPPATAGEGLDDIERSAQALADFKGPIPPGASDAFMLGWRVRDREAPCDGVARTTNAPTPAPEAKRPTHVRVIRRGTNAPAFVTNGAVFKVEEWDAVGDPWIDGWCFCGNRVASPSNTIWEPAPCPPPVAGRGEKDEAVRGLVAFAARVSDTLRLDGTKRNADLVTEAGRLVALAREAGLCEGGSK